MGRPRQTLRQLTDLNLADIHLPKRKGGKEPGLAEAVSRMAEALARQGQRQPVLVTHGAKFPPYQLVLGRKRLLAARRLGWQRISAIVVGPHAQFSRPLAVLTTLPQDQFNPFRLADALQELGEVCGWTQSHLGLAIGRTRDFVANILAITNIQPEVRLWLEKQGKRAALTARHLRYVGRAVPDQQMTLARRIVKDGLSTKKLEEVNRRGRTPPRQRLRIRALRDQDPSFSPESDRDWRHYYRRLSTDLRRIERQTAMESQRIQRRIKADQTRLKTLNREIREKRNLLKSELQFALRHMHRTGVK
ncbi:MAG: ParB N-terminal domain-containing protein [Deltaproteobacteria bacterium]|nr:ParB N-terminal domain-containing protein [Deltaproteobacteria bacterium]